MSKMLIFSLIGKPMILETPEADYEKEIRLLYALEKDEDEETAASLLEEMTSLKATKEHEKQSNKDAKKALKKDKPSAKDKKKTKADSEEDADATSDS